MQLVRTRGHLSNTLFTLSQERFKSELMDKAERSRNNIARTKMLQNAAVGDHCWTNF